MADVSQKPDWSKMKFGAEYLSPTYYNKILKKYSAENSADEDIEILAGFIKEQCDNPSILELGCGSGRATKVIAGTAQCQKFVVTDLSRQMLDFVKAENLPCISGYENTDHLEYLQKTKEQFDLVVSLWSLAHSVFPWYTHYGSSSFKLIEEILTNFFTSNLNRGGRVFIVQTDGASEEQSLIKNSWFLGSNPSNLEDEYYKNFQSPSVWILSAVFERLVDSGIFNKSGTNVSYVTGKSIDYESVDEALEIFMNFHLEGEFNDTDQFYDVYAFLKNEFEKIITMKGRLAIGTGFWVYEGQK